MDGLSLLLTKVCKCAHKTVSRRVNYLSNINGYRRRQPPDLPRRGPSFIKPTKINTKAAILYTVGIN